MKIFLKFQEKLYQDVFALQKLLKRKLESSEQLKKIMTDYYLDLKENDEKESRQPVAWCTSAGPSELLRAFGFKVYFPENHTAILGSSRIANDVIPLANSAGYSPDICSYLTSDVGAYLAGVTPLTKMYGMKSVPKPDVLVYNTNQCRDVQDWFSWYSKRLGIPVFGIHPPTHIPEVGEPQISYVSSQFEELITNLEKVSDQKFDMGKLKSTLKVARENAQLWDTVLKTAQHLPSPLDFFDSCIQMGPIVVLRGEQVVSDYYNQLLNELHERMEENIGVIDNEEVRLYWDGMPIWGKLKSLSNHFSELNACVVASTYCNSWSFSDIDPNDPIRSMAQTFTQIFINRSESFKTEYLEKMANDYQVDGFVFHDSKTCPNNSNNRYRMPQRVQEITKLPVITVNGDQNDLRCFSEEQAKTSLEAFVEQIKTNKELAI